MESDPIIIQAVWAPVVIFCLHRNTPGALRLTDELFLSSRGTRVKFNNDTLVQSDSGSWCEANPNFVRILLKKISRVYWRAFRRVLMIKKQFLPTKRYSELLSSKSALVLMIRNSLDSKRIMSLIWGKALLKTVAFLGIRIWKCFWIMKSNLLNTCLAGLPRLPEDLCRPLKNFVASKRASRLTAPWALQILL